jgi:hypothetical protein
MTFTALEQWRLANFGSIANTGNAADSADPDGDGRSNKLEYATATNPTIADGGQAATLGTSPDGTKLTLKFQRIADPNLTYEVQATDDFSTWNVIWSSSGSQNVAGEVEVSDSELMTAHTKRFLRLRVNP